MVVEADPPDSPLGVFMLSQNFADEYDNLFARAAIRPEHQFEIDVVVTRIFDPHNLAQLPGGGGSHPDSHLRGRDHPQSPASSIAVTATAPVVVLDHRAPLHQA